MIEDEKGNWDKFQWVSRCHYRKKNDDNEAGIEIQWHET